MRGLNVYIAGGGAGLGSENCLCRTVLGECLIPPQTSPPIIRRITTQEQTVDKETVTLAKMEMKSLKKETLRRDKTEEKKKRVSQPVRNGEGSDGPYKQER